MKQLHTSGPGGRRAPWPPTTGGQTEICNLLSRWFSWRMPKWRQPARHSANQEEV